MMRQSRFSRYVETPTLRPPKLSDFGHQPFTSSARETLARLMREPTWPRDTLNIYSLEGYLTALLVWPVALQPGAWLPPIWNEASWRVRPPIDTEDRYGEFVEVVVGFLRTIDGGLLQTPPVFESVIHLPFSDELEMLDRAQCWAHGFGRGLRQGVQAQVAPTQGAREAVNAIAAYANTRTPLSKGGAQQVDSALSKAVLALASTRTSRGPLGALPKQLSTAARTDHPKVESTKEVDC
jgi:yecA family protein